MNSFRIFLKSLLLLLPFAASAQAYGPEWITWGQQYAKIPVIQAGLHELEVQQVQNAGLSIQGKASSGLKLYCLGKQQALQIWDGGDGTLDPGDRIGFWGQPNKGEMDSALYQDGKQTSPGFSLFQDTAFYYLSWSAGSGTAGFTLQNSLPAGSLSPEPWYIFRQLNHYTDAYFDGLIILGYGAFSEYTDGEGWAGARFNKTQNQTRTLSTPNYVSSGPSPTYKIRMLGKSDEVSAVPEINHHLRVDVSPDLTPYTVLRDTLYKGFTTVDLSGTLPAAKIGSSSTRFQFTGVDNIGAVSDFQTTAWIELAYPRNFNLNNSNSANLELGNSSSNRLLQFTGYAAGFNAPLLIHPGLKSILRPVKNADTLWFVIPAGWQGTFYLRDSVNSVKPAIQKIIQPVDPTPASAGQFLIISHPSLANGVTAYVNYRQSKGYNCTVAYTPDLYDIFSYGLHHPLAIRNYCRYLALQNKMPEYLLLLGKGQSPERIRFNAANFQADLVPTIGFPPSDLQFVSGINGPVWVPSIQTGRVPASNEQEIFTYLDKLQAYENSLADPSRKQFLHLGGGRNQSENDYYRNSLAVMQGIAEDTLLGAAVSNFYKDDAIPVNTTLKIPIQEHINRGVGFLNYFGHGAADILEIDIGTASELSNNNRYPVMYFSGCILGNSFTDNSLGEDFLFTPGKGAVGWMGTTSYGFNHILDIYAQQFYREAFQDSYGTSLAGLQRRVISSFTDSTDVYAQMLCRQMLLEGDPALTLYAPSAPDLGFGTDPVSIAANANADTDSLKFRISLLNIGKATHDSMSILVRRTFPGGQTAPDTSIRTRIPYFEQFLDISLPQAAGKTTGTNNLQLILDAGSEVNELNEANNEYTLSFYLPGRGSAILFPIDKAIVNNTSLHLQAGLLTPRRGAYDYAMELDTSKNFNSPLLQKALLTGQSFTANWDVSIPDMDSTTWYFRSRLEDPVQPAAWSQHSFTYYKGSRNGISHHHFSQTLEGSFNYLDPDTLEKTIDFSRVTSVIHAAFTSGSSGVQSGRLFRINYFATRIGSILDGISVLAINPDDVTRYSYPSPYNQSANYAGVYGPPQYTLSGVFFFNTTLAADRDSLAAHLKRIPAGYHVLLHNGRFTGVNSWDTSLFNAFGLVGGTRIRQLKEGHPYILSGKKGLAPGAAVELLADTLSPIPATQQLLSFATVYYPKGTSGKWTSETAGPAQRWESIHWNTYGQDHPRDTFRVNVYGQSGTQWTLLNSSFLNDSIDLGGINAKDYPYLKLELVLKDDSLRTPVQWKDLTVYYEPAPDLSVEPNLSTDLPDSTDAGYPLNAGIVFKNISPIAVNDSFVVQWGIKNKTGSTIISQKVPELAPGDTSSIRVQMNTDTWSEGQLLFAQLNPAPGIPEQYDFNNYFQDGSWYRSDLRNPLLDITYDGKHIQDGEIIRPDPMVLITLRDDDVYKLLNDTNRAKLWIKAPGASQHVRIGYNDPRIVFQPATSGNNKASITFNPVFEQDGVYELKVAAVDASGNAAASDDLVSRFEINRHPAITQILPYPNPFTSQCRFVFTLTGTSIPDDIRIQIMTLSGKVVKEIRKEEMGPLRIGNNITEYSWNGTDQYGDILANGVYLYKVIARNKGQHLDHRNTSADRYFENNLGKIYILR